MPRYLSTDVCNLLVTQVALFITLLACYINVTDRWCVEVILDQLSETFDDMFESAACNKEMVLVFGMEESAQRRQHYRANVQIPNRRSALYDLKKF